MARLLEQPQTKTDVEERGRLGRGTARREIETAVVRLRVLARALCEIQHDRGRCSGELVGQMTAASRKSLDHFVRKDQEFECDLVHVELFVIEHVSPVGTIAAELRTSRTG